MPTKLEKFAQLHTFKNVSEHHQLESLPRLQEFISSHDNVTLELACGRGEYSTGLAKLHPEVGHIGVDIQGERIWYGATAATEEGLENVFFLRCYIERLLEYLPTKSVDTIWITFPDPFTKDRYERKRLTNPRFLDIYAQILKPNGLLHLKTDNPGLFEYSLEQIEASKPFSLVESQSDIYAGDEIRPELQIQTKFEGKHLAKGRKINYLQARRK